METFVNKLSDCLTNCIEDKNHFKKNSELLTYELDLKQIELNDMKESHKKEQHLIATKFSTNNSASDFYSDSRSPRKNKIPINQKCYDSKENEYIIKLEAKCELLSQKLKKYATSESSYKIDIEKCK